MRELSWGGRMDHVEYVRTLDATQREEVESHWNTFRRRRENEG